MIAKDLRINPLRTSLTALSMFIGIIALIAGVLVGTLGRDYLEAVNARLGGKSPTYSAIVDVPSSVNIQSRHGFAGTPRAFPSGNRIGAISPQRPRHMGVVR